MNGFVTQLSPHPLLPLYGAKQIPLTQRHVHAQGPQDFDLCSTSKTFLFAWTLFRLIL